MNISELSKEQKEDALYVFNIFDVDNDKLLDIRELKSALRALGFEVKKEEIMLVISSCLGNSLGLSISSNKVLGNSLTSSTGDGFSYQRNQDNDRYIDYDEFCMILGYLMNINGKYGVGAFYGNEDSSEEVSIEYVRKIFALFDLNKTGKIGLRNFKMLTSQISKELSNLNIKDFSEKNELLFTDEELIQMIKHVDRDNDGLLDLDDFYKVFHYCHSNNDSI